MAYILGVPLLALLAVFQSSVVSQFQLLDGRPDLVLLAVVAWGLAGRSEEAMVWGLIGGLFLDLLSGLPFGTSPITLVIVAFLVSLMEGRFWEAHFLMPLGVMLLASLVYYFLGSIVLVLIGRELELSFILTRVIMPSIFLNLALVIPAKHLADGLRNRLFPPEIQI